MAAGNVTNSNLQADTRCVEVVRRCGHLSGVALSQTDDVSSGRSFLLKQERRFSNGGDSNIDYREGLRQQSPGCEHDDGILAIADAGP